MKNHYYRVRGKDLKGFMGSGENNKVNDLNENSLDQTVGEHSHETGTIQQLFDEFDLLDSKNEENIEIRIFAIMLSVKEIWKDFELNLPALYKKRENLDEFLALEYSRKLININRWLFDIVSLDTQYIDKHYLDKKRKLDYFKGDLEGILELFFSLLAFERTVLKLGIQEFELIKVEEIYNKLKQEYNNICLLEVLGF